MGYNGAKFSIRIKINYDAGFGGIRLLSDTNIRIITRGND